MPWGAVAGAVVGAVANKALAPSASSGGGAGTTTNTKEPWAAAAPWIQQNLAQGQQLQQQYTDQPFSQAQQQAYTNQAAQSDYMRQLIPSLLGQMSNQTLGFDRNNPEAKPTAYNFLLNPDGTQNTTNAGLLGSGSMLAAQAGDAAATQAQKDAAAKAAADKAAADKAAADQADALQKLLSAQAGQQTDAYGVYGGTQYR